LNTWFSDPAAALFCTICHHGSPVAQAAISVALAKVRWQIDAAAGYDPLAEMDRLAAVLLERFPVALDAAAPIRWTSSFDHLFAGVVMLSDWFGSSLPVAGPDWRPEAVDALLSTLPWSGWHAGAPATDILPGPPLGAQAVIGEVPLGDRLVVIEAPTGTGKTEAALLRALQLTAAGLVDGLYFALPTRATAPEIHDRIARLARSHSPALATRVVRAVPGRLDTDSIERAVPGLLDSDPWQQPAQAKSWAIASPKRVMAAPIVVGTIDQAMLSVLRTRHAWMRHAALSRHLLIIDEVHASDPYILEIVHSLVQRHLAVGGHCLLMSATLGEVLRAELEHRPRLSLAEAQVAPYPAVNSLPVAVARIRSALRLADYGTAMGDVVACVRDGHCALVIRSTMDTARETYQELLTAGVPALLHHARYADLDRQYLDARLVGVIGKYGTRTPLAIVATQTAEQSLDIDADLLVSDPAPADVRLLVETATHPDSLQAFADRCGWTCLWQETWGKRLAQRQSAQGGLLDWTRPYAEQPVTDAVPTRLGDGMVTLKLSTPIPSPFTGAIIEALPLPGRWLRDVAPGTPGVPAADGDEGSLINVGGKQFRYSVLGLCR
jgi:CRISPR-associated endonuclease/helicase Cas3